MILLPPEGSQYDVSFKKINLNFFFYFLVFQEIVDHRGPDEDDFGVLDDDENIEGSWKIDKFRKYRKKYRKNQKFARKINF